MGDSECVLGATLQTLSDAELERDRLRALLERNVAHSDEVGCLVAGAALVLCLDIASDHYTGFELAAEAVRSHRHAKGQIADPSLRLVADAGDLVVGWLDELGNPALLPLAEQIVRELSRKDVPATLRLAAALGVMSYFDALVDIEKVWWLELVVRDVLAEAPAAPRLEAEWHRALVVACYSCGQTARGEELRRQRSASPALPFAAVELKLELLDAYTSLGEGRVDAGRSALARAEPLLSARSPYNAGQWHFLASRLAMLEQRLGDALNHARLAMRFGTESCYPERWMGLSLMQEGQVHMARGSFFEAVPSFERAERACTGVQSAYSTCLANFARALGHADAGNAEAAHGALVAAFTFARQREWTGFFRAIPKLTARLCAWALEADIEPAFARAVIADRKLEAASVETAAWPWSIRVRTLGRFEIEINGAALSMRGKGARKPLELLQFIIASGGSDVACANVIFAVWPELDGDNANSAFRVAVHRLRRLLGNDEAITLEIGRLGLDPRVMWVDCLAFESVADQVTLPLTAASAQRAERALTLYGGHFLHDDEEHAWLLVQRSRLASKFKRLARALAEHAMAAGNFAAARTALERAIELDPLAEDLSRSLMQLLATQGEHAAALAVYERNVATLQRLLGAQPSSANRALAANLRGGPAESAESTTAA